MTFEEAYLPNQWLPFGAAMTFHVMLLMWDPTILKASPYHFATPVINVRMMDHLPVMVPVKPVVKPVEKTIQKKEHVKKAKKSGLSLSAKARPLETRRHHPVPAKARAAPKPYVPKITMPKFVPHESEETIAASPIPGRAPAAAVHVSRTLAPPPRIHGKSRGVRASDIQFELSDRGAIAPMVGSGVVIPVAEERGEIASLPSAPMIHDAPIRSKAVPGYRFTPGQGSGSGELVGRDKSGHIGYHGAAKADMYVEGTLEGAAGDGRGSKVVTGKGFEIGGPVGDRKIMMRHLPEYPAWAEEKGVTALVKLYFTVRPDGTLRSTVRVVTSSGYAELDDLAKDALLRWRFSPTSSNSSADTAWGVITFRFTLA